MTIVDAGVLKDFTADCYVALGVPGEASALLAETLVQAELWGHPSHGVMRLFWYGARIENGATQVEAVPEVIASPPAISMIDGQDGIGQVMAQAAMTRAVAAARSHGIGAVSVRNSGHFGTAMYFTRMAAEAGCIGFLSTNGSPAMAPWGGREKKLGNNPWSWAAPAGKFPTMMLDLANTAVARGKLYIAKARGEEVPLGWAIDGNGDDTTDPAAGIAGTILPMAGHKGYAITTLMDVLSGVLSGSAFGTSVVGPYVPEGRSGVGHLAIAIDIAAIRPLGEFEADMERLISDIKSTPRTPGTDEIFYPGEREARSEERLLSEGITLPDSVVKDLREGAGKLAIASPF